MNLDIEPIQIGTPKVCDRVYVQLRNLNFNESVTMNVIFLEKRDVGMKVVDDKCIVISGDEYKAWGNDDNYLIDLVLSKVGIKLAKV